MAIFMKVDGVEGDSQDSAHEKWIDLMSWSWGAHHPSDMQTGGGTSGGSAQVDQVNVMCKTSSATATLMSFCLKGEVKKIDIHATKRYPGDTEDTWQEIVLTNATITSLNQGYDSSPDGADSCFDQIVISFEDGEQKIFDQKADGTKGAEKSWGFEVGTRTPR